MKIATITCHDVYNYGASLQAYALQEYCKSLGCKYEIIDYKPDYLSNHFKLSLVANPRFNHPIVKQLYLLAKLPERIIGLQKKKRFDVFRQKYLATSTKRYGSNNELQNNPPIADLYIAGSDQIWNTFFKNGHDKAFYLDFTPNGSRKISYAASFATDRIYGGAEQFVTEKLQKFDAVSVRESSALRLLEKLGRFDGQLVCDPVFLLSRGQWDEMISDMVKHKSEYILIYDCERSIQLREIALSLSKSTGLPIHSLSTTADYYANKKLSLGGPLDFLNEIASARYVLANSFHALAFSLIFKKDFFIVNRSENINTRMLDFLKYLDLSNRLISSPSDITFSQLNFDSVELKLQGLINQSKQFLRDQIETVEKLF